MKRRLFIVLSLSTLMAACSAAANNQGEPQSFTITVSVAASLQNAMKAIAQIYQNQAPNTVIIYNFGSSGSLQQQIEQGAPVDLFISAAPEQINALEAKNLLLAGTRQDLLTNQILAIAPKEATGISDWKDLATDRVSKIAISNPDSVPAGKYAKEVLEALNLYDRIKPKLVFTKDVRQVLAYVETGNVDAGVVYATDAQLSNGVKAIAVARKEHHSPIVYPVAVVKDSKQPEAAKAFLQFLSSPEAKAAFEQYGFKIAGN
ncbi:MAG: molybdate ABC transporter substrate-binding protein [Oscillatoria sp. SIO1A7]|nr:molybdate ABC transporter substrate-binding protein [Oscillatoria sp. SIO1A7]